MKLKTLSILVGVAIVLLGARALAEQGEVRLRIAVVLDASMSMNQQDPDKLAVVAARLLVDLATPQDEVTLFLFGTEAQQIGRERVRDDAARERLYRALAAAERDQWCTDYRVGLQAALEALGTEERPGERRLVIFLTDGLFDPDRSNLSYYTTDEGREARERAARSRGFTERPCARTYNRLVEHVEPGFLAQMEELTERYADSGLRLYTVGLGSDLNTNTDEARRSREMLEQLAGATGGSFLAATSADQLPRFFAAIYSALVGAVVEEPTGIDQEQTTFRFEVLRGARRVAVVAAAAGNPALRLSLGGPGGAAPSPRRRGFNTDTPAAHGYRLLSLDAPAAGQYRLSCIASHPLCETLVIEEVGLRLAIEGLPRAGRDGTAPRITVGLRSSAGDPVRLSGEFLSQVRVEMTFGPAGSEPEPRPLTLDPEAQAEVALPALAPGTYRFTARARHTQGLLHVPPVEAAIEVIHQLEIDLARSKIAFDVMAEDGDDDLSRGAVIRLAEGTKLPVEQEFVADWSGVSGRDLLEHGPERFTLGPEKASVPVVLRFRDQSGLRGRSERFEGTVKVRPVSAELFRGDPSWEPLEIDGRLRPWDWRRYYREYAIYLWSGVGGSLLLVLILGFLVRRRWPKRAKLHYIDKEDPTGQETAISLARRSRSKLPYRSDRHRIGRGGRPGRARKRRYCTFVATGRRFKVVPGDVSLTYERDGEERTARQPFQGRWEERYQLGDKYEVWLTRG